MTSNAAELNDIDELIEVPAGLRHVIAAETRLGDVRGREGFYHYRQYSAIDLATTCTFEEVWFLLFEGRLPGAAELAAFTAETARLRTLPADLLPLLAPIAAAGERLRPMAGLRTALSLLAGLRDLAPMWDSAPAQRKSDALMICAVTPTILAALHRLHRGLAPLTPRADLSTAANWLYLLTGEVPEARAARAVEQYLIATIDHGFNASTFAGRVVAPPPAPQPTRHHPPQGGVIGTPPRAGPVALGRCSLVRAQPTSSSSGSATGSACLPRLPKKAESATSAPTIETAAAKIRPGR